jgi:hypothetical protein
MREVVSEVEDCLDMGRRSCAVSLAEATNGRFSQVCDQQLGSADGRQLHSARAAR